MLSKIFVFCISFSKGVVSFTLVTLAVNSFNLVELQYDYKYDYNLATEKGVTKGSRLVNARAATIEDSFGFVGAFFLSSHKSLKSPLCTAALITPKVALR